MFSLFSGIFFIFLTSALNLFYKVPIDNNEKGNQAAAGFPFHADQAEMPTKIEGGKIMRINNNLMAMNTYRQLGLGEAAASRSMEKLSSGYRINRAGDDAAGLAISEKMRGQIRGLTQASRNAQDSISLVQSAEGALSETQAILQRMRELAVQSASDTNVNADRTAVQNEMDQLAEEVSRISNDTEFNTQKLLDGSFSGTFHIGANESQNLRLSISNMSSSALGTTAVNVTADEAGTVVNTGNSFSDGVYNVTAEDEKYYLADSNGKNVASSDDGLTFTSLTVEGDTVTFTDEVLSGTVAIKGDAAVGSARVANNGLEAGTYTVSGTNLIDKNGNVIAKAGDSGEGTAFTALDGETVLFTVNDALEDGASVKVGGIDVSSQTAADHAITTINDAITSVSNERAKLGATQNRLDHTIKNLDTSSENLQSAESRIRDVDMAKEMMEFTKDSILQQAAQAMLAQANQAPQGVLQLLR